MFSPSLRATTSGLLVLITLVAFEAMGVAAALPTAARELHGLAGYGWAFTGMLVGNVVGLVVSGQLSDQRGPRLPLVSGLVTFVAGLLLSGSSVSMAEFVAGRFVQGFGGGMLITAVYVVLGEMYGEQLRPKVFAAMSGAWVVPALAGPLVAGFLTQHASWRWVFLGLVPFAVAGAGLMVPALRRLRTRPSGRKTWLGDPRRVLRALAVAAGVAALEAAGQHPSAASAALVLAGIAALAWGLRALLPPGTLRVRPGVSAPIALRGLIAGSFFGVDSMVPLTLTVQHRYSAVAAGLPLAASGVSWAVGSWWQGRSQVSDRVGLIRAGLGFIAVAAAATAVVAFPAVPGWVMYGTWALAGIGAGLGISSVGVLLLNYTTDADRGADSAALQVADVVTVSLTTGLAGVLVAAAAAGPLGYTSAFVFLDLSMAALALLGVAVARRARPAAAAR
jgi:MFS family permease